VKCHNACEPFTLVTWQYRQSDKLRSGKQLCLRFTLADQWRRKISSTAAAPAACAVHRLLKFALTEPGIVNSAWLQVVHGQISCLVTGSARSLHEQHGAAASLQRRPSSRSTWRQVRARHRRGGMGPPWWWTSFQGC
jgi:hypothetical protein